uniref:Midgut cadherin-like protein n=1 Tax=Chilo infuscatellus TaxID=236790 RepID=A0A4D6WLI2_9NEOP|nr:midgut cadherin-like protein [Chilo infuscatellus]
MMGVKLLAALLMLALVVVVNTQQEHCSYMTDIPRPPRPELPEVDAEGLTWSQRPLLPPPAREEVCMGLYQSNGNTGQQVIFMEEEIQGDVIIAKLNYQGTATPTIELPLILGGFDNLGPVFRRIPELNNDWYLVITQRQDYEIAVMRNYQFVIQVEGETLRAGVSLVIVNIDDNPPIIHALEPCVVPELGYARLTECVYEVTDVDGRISTWNMTFEVHSDRNDDEIFYMKGENIENTWHTMLMTVGITRPLNFENNRLHIFTVVAKDSLPNNDTVTMLVQVANVEHRPPRWVEIFTVQQFDEMSHQQFNVRAIDADIEIDKEIHYKLITEPEDTFFSIKPNDEEGATLFVDPIDRDTLEREIFRLSIVAYKFDNESLATEANVIIIVNDINNQRPEPLQKGYFTSIEEETPFTLDFGPDFGFHDRDLGDNARYTVELRDVTPPEASAAFAISPDEGYQRQTFIMSTINHTMLDYEVPEFQNIILELVATDKNNSDFVGVATLYINLINWNDEVPIFEQPSYEVTFKETVEKDFHVATVLANDRDIDDKVVHSLMGNAGELLRINEDTGDVYVDVNDAFDFHRQNVLFVQVRADDTLRALDRGTHTTTTQLVIHLEDVNNTPPTLRLPRNSPSVEENVPEGHVIETTIRATDPDTTAHLVFEINWEDSWATKQGRPTNVEEYSGCVAIETIYDNEDILGSARGTIVAKEIRPGVTIDFEEFEVLYLSIRVRDLNTVIGDEYDEATFTVNIIDMNDNAPQFSLGSLEQSMRVREVSPTGTVIGSILATDIDGPLYNNVHYRLVPINDTPDGLVKIDPISGQITVDEDEAIDADIPPRYHLYYQVIASDQCLEDECPPDPNHFNETGYIQIAIQDTNNKVPVERVDLFQSVVPIYEKSPSGYQIVQLFSQDDDRDELYNTVRYQINYEWNPQLRLFFEIDMDTGWLYVNYTSDEVLDRDFGEPRHTIFVNLIDNFFTAGEGRRNQNTSIIEVVLLDINDNAPLMPEDLTWSISEALLAGELVDPVIFAPDYDEPGTNNSLVGYRVLDMNTTRDIDVPILFETYLIEHDEGNRARLRTLQDLRGFWGNHMIHITAFDHGDPPLDSDMWYPVEIRPYNYYDPEFVFPIHGTTLRFARERAVENNPLTLADGNVLPRISATDQDGLHAGLVTFSVVGDAAAMEHFTVRNDGENLGTLILTKIPEDITECQLTIRATDGGTEPFARSTELTVRALFVTTIGEPIFTDNTVTVPFTEGPTGLQQSHDLPHATDPKNYDCLDDCNDIFYRIVGGNTGGFFQLDPVQNRLSLTRALDRQQERSHSIVVAASNSPSATGTPLDGTTLTVTINVIEEDPRPVFERELCTAGISVLDTIQRELLTVQATHSLDDDISYAIDDASMVADSSLAAVAGTAFVLHERSGVLSLNIQPTANMHGMFEFDVTATDSNGGVGRAQVKIYLISSQNRVVFIFENTVDEIVNSTDFIAATFTSAFRMTCNIDQVLVGSDDSGAARPHTSEVRAHFIRDNVPVPADEIEPLRSDTVLLTQIQQRLNERSLVLQDLSTGPTPIADAVQTAVYVLAGLCVLLTLLLLILLVVFSFKTSALNRRMKAMSMTKFGSVDSGLNRMGLTPGTNKHSVEGSNPIYNETIKAPDFDAISDVSNESDLIGIEDLPQFRGDYLPPEDSNSMQGIMGEQSDSVATHNNNFGFMTSPFSPEFTNKQFRR